MIVGSPTTFWSRDRASLWTAKGRSLFVSRHHSRAVEFPGPRGSGDRWPTVPDEIIVELRIAMRGQDLRVIEDTLHAGDQVQIAAGPMHGLEAVVTRVMPSKQRVAVLLDFLGRQTTIEMDRRQLTFVAEEESQRVRTPVWTDLEELAPVIG